MNPAMDRAHKTAFVLIPGMAKDVSGNLFPKSLGMRMMLVLVFFALGFPHLTVAQTLNEALKIQLDGDCSGLTGLGSAVGLSALLNSICTDSNGDGPGTIADTSIGGGTALIQTLTLSVDNRRKARLGNFKGPSVPLLAKMATAQLGGDTVAFSILGSGQQPSASPQSPGPGSGGPSSPKGSSPSIPGGMLSGLLQMKDQFVKDLSLYISANVESVDRDQTRFADGFSSTLVGGTIGGDYQWNNQFLMGSALTFTNTTGDFDGGGDFDTNAYELVIYGAWMPIAQAFLDVAFGFVSKDHSVSRPVSYAEAGDGPGSVTLSGTTGSDSDGRAISLHVLSGYDHTLGPVTIGPRAGLNFTNLHIDGYSETGGGGLALIFDEQNANSFQSILGLQGSMAVATSYGVWAPQATADFVHEFANDQQFVTVRFAGDGRPTPTKFKFQTERPVRNFFDVGIGTVLILPHGIQPYVNFRAMVGNEHFTNFAGTIGLRIEMAQALALL